MLTEPLPPISTLAARLMIYDGQLYWRPVRTDTPHAVTWNKKNAGRRVGAPKGNGYLMFRLGGRCLLVHRVVYALHYGQDPGPLTVDHANGDRADNRPENLRLATNAENVQHRNGPGANNSSGVVGVYWHRAARKWAASIRVNGTSVHLGLFADIAEAAEVRRAAELRYFRLKGQR